MNKKEPDVGDSPVTVALRMDPMTVNWRLTFSASASPEPPNATRTALPPAAVPTPITKVSDVVLVIAQLLALKKTPETLPTFASQG